MVQEPRPTLGDAILDVVSELEPGQVVSYSWVALEAGRPRAARAVGGSLAASPDTPNWWRVVAADGRIVSPRPEEQMRRLRAEGHRIVDGRLTTSPQHPRA